MNFTEIQLVAMTKMAIEASAVDGECDVREKEFILRHIGELSPGKIITPIVDKSFKLFVDDAIDIIRTMSLNQKRHFCAFIAMVLLADDIIQPSEMEFWGILTKEAELPIMSFGEARSIFSDNFNDGNKSSDQYDELSKIASLRYLIATHKSLGDYSKAQAYENELLVLLQQKQARERRIY